MVGHVHVDVVAEELDEGRVVAVDLVRGARGEKGEGREGEGEGGEALSFRVSSSPGACRKSASSPSRSAAPWPRSTPRRA